MALSELPQLGLDETAEGMNDPKIIVALDFADARHAFEFSHRIDPGQCRLKVGKELFTRAGPGLVKSLVADGFDIFLDLKFHDIPNTVRQAARAAAELGVWMFNVHALGGEAMMRAARAGIDDAAQRPLLVAVTILTSQTDSDLAALGIDRPLPELVESLARRALDCGLDGVVCSAHEAPALRASLGAAALLVTPGIRPDWATADDQQRILTPEAALAGGASYLVIGRPITRADDPAAALERIQASIREAA